MAVIPEDTPIPVRDPLAGHIDAFWARLGRPGTWWTGEQRVAIIEETRNAVGCAYCARCKEAVSPFAESGDHDHLGALPDAVVDIIHRLVNDPGRLTRTWYQRTIDSGVTEGEYVETAAIVADVICVDTFQRGLGLPLPALPDVVAGEPSRETPECVETTIAWVPTVPRDKATGELAETWYPDGQRVFVPPVRQAFSLVPDECIAFMRLSAEMYIDNKDMNDFAAGRTLKRPQMELLAARTSLLNE